MSTQPISDRNYLRQLSDREILQRVKDARTPTWLELALAERLEDALDEPRRLEREMGQMEDRIDELKAELEEANDEIASLENKPE